MRHALIAPASTLRLKDVGYSNEASAYVILFATQITRRPSG